MKQRKPMPFENLAQQTFGKLFVIGRVDRNKINKKYGTYFLCKCSCGSFLFVRGYDLKTGGKTRCRECYLASRITHGASKTRLYGIWSNVKERTLNPYCDGYKKYGARGIDICDDWLDFLVFKDWALSHGYDDSLTIERLDNYKGYCPENCTWIPAEKQARNKRNNLYFELNGERKLLKDWAEIYSMPYSTVYGRVFNSKMSLEDALTKPLAYNDKYRGVFFKPDRNKWVAIFHRHKKRYFVGYFDDKDEALTAKNKFMEEKGFLVSDTQNNKVDI